MTTANDHTELHSAAGPPQAADGFLVDDTHLFTFPPCGEVNDGSSHIESSSQNLQQSDCATEARAYWLNDSLALSAFFTASQYPHALWQTSSTHSLSTCQLVERVLDKKGLRRIIALQVGADIVTHCVPAVAKILHSLGDKCLCQSSVEDKTTENEDWFRQQIDMAVPEFLWHAGRTPFARANYLMVLVEEIFRTLPISWSDAIAQAEDSDGLSHALECINEAVRCAEVAPQAVLGVWAANNMMPVAHISEQQHAQPVSQTTVLKAYQSDDGIMPSPPDSECSTCLIKTTIADEDDAKSVGSTFSTTSDRGQIRRSPEETSPEKTLPEISQGCASAFDKLEMPTVRSSRALAPEYDMTHHPMDDTLDDMTCDPVDDTLGDIDYKSRKRRRSDHGERRQVSKRKVVSIVIDD